MANFKTGDEISRILRRERRIREGVQPVLESGVDIKTVNSESLVGPGNLDIAGGPGGASAWGSITGTLADQTDLKAALDSKAPNTSTIGASFDGGGDVLIVGSTCDVYVPYGFTITKATMLADQNGSLVIDIWRDSYANFPPSVADSITAAAKPTLSASSIYQDSTLTGWSKTVPANSIIRFRIDSCSVITRAVITLEGTKS